MRHLLMSTAIGRIMAPMAFMSETVIIDTDNGPVMIEKSDYDPTKHELHALNGTLIPTPDQPGPQPAPPPNGPPATPQPAHHATPAGALSPAGIQANAPAAPTTPEPVMITDPEMIARINAMKFAVITTGKGKNARFFIVDTLNGGNPVEDVPGIDVGGYTNNKDAWDALHAVQLSVPPPAAA